jgi:four helix bundle protein
VGAKHFRELVVWQLADRLRDYAFTITSTGPSSSDFEFRRQIRASSASVADNIAEGFGRYSHGDFARFLSIAKASLDETENHFIKGEKRRYFTNDQATSGMNAVVRTRRTLLGLMRYLRQNEAPRPFSRDRSP